MISLAVAVLPVRKAYEKRSSCMKEGTVERPKKAGTEYETY